jgi:hypothetical protein
MYQAMVREIKGGFNHIVYWSRLSDWKNQTLTPNPDAIYLMPFINTKDVGPVVIEIPPAEEGSITGTIMDSWQTPLADVGPAGVDAGKGGKYVVLPPDFTDKAPYGYIALPSVTYQGYALLRSILKGGSDTDIVTAVDYGKRIKVYPLSTAANPPATTFVDAINVVYDATIPYDIRFFQSLDRFVQGERWITRDKVMIDQLARLALRRASHSLPITKPRAFSTPLRVRRMPSWNSTTKTSSHRISPTAGGHCQHSRSTSRQHRAATPRPMNIRLTLADLFSPSLFSRPRPVGGVRST